MEQFQHGGAFAAGEDKAVDARQLLRRADENGVGSRGGEGFGVRFEIALQGENSGGFGQ
jgi:hypothetical protein